MSLNEWLWPRLDFWLESFNKLYLGLHLAFLNGPFTAPFSFIFVFSLQLNIIWVWWDSNRGSQVSGATSLATASQATASLYLALSPKFFPQPRIQNRLRSSRRAQNTFRIIKTEFSSTAHHLAGLKPKMSDFSERAQCLKAFLRGKPGK